MDAVNAEVTSVHDAAEVLPGRSARESHAPMHMTTSQGLLTAPSDGIRTVRPEYRPVPVAQSMDVNAAEVQLTAPTRQDVRATVPDEIQPVRPAHRP